MKPAEIIQWLEVCLLILLLGTGSVVASVYISGLVFHNENDVVFIHLDKEHWNCLEYTKSDIPGREQCVVYRRSY